MLNSTYYFMFLLFIPNILSLRLFFKPVNEILTLSLKECKDNFCSKISCMYPLM